MKLKMVNVHDPNEYHTLESETSEEACFEALEMLGWAIAEDWEAEELYNGNDKTDTTEVEGGSKGSGGREGSGDDERE